MENRFRKPIPKTDSENRFRTDSNRSEPIRFRTDPNRFRTDPNRFENRSDQLTNRPTNVQSDCLLDRPQVQFQSDRFQSVRSSFVRPSLVRTSPAPVGREQSVQLLYRSGRPVSSNRSFVRCTNQLPVRSSPSGPSPVVEYRSQSFWPDCLSYCPVGDPSHTLVVLKDGQHLLLVNATLTPSKRKRFTKDI